MATIIKHDMPVQRSATEVRRVAYDLADLGGQAEQYLGQVRQEATKIIQQAKEESQKIEQQAEQAGRKAAQDAIESILDEKVGKQMLTLLPALTSAVQQIEDSRHDWLRQWESTVVQLACAIAKRIVRREIAQQPEIPIEWAKEALQLCSGAAAITIRLNPIDHETLGGQIERIAETFHPTAEATIVADEAISPAGCRVETKFGSIDQQLETQLQRIQQELS